MQYPSKLGVQTSRYERNTQLAAPLIPRPVPNQPPTVYTTTNPHGDAENALATRVPLPMNARYANMLRYRGAYGSPIQVGSGAPVVWEVGVDEGWTKRLS